MSDKIRTAPASIAVAPLLYALAAAIVLSHSIAAIVLGLLWLLVLWTLFQDRRRPELSLTEIILIVFVFWCLLTAFLNGLDWTNIKKYYYYTPLLVIPRLNISERLLGRLIIFLGIVCAAVILLAMSQKMLGFDLPGPYQAYRGPRFYGFTGHPIPMAGLYSIAALMCLCLCLYARREVIDKVANMPALLICVGILAFGVLLTESRSFYIAFFIASGLAVYVSGNRKAMLSFAVVMGLALLYVLFDARLSDRIMTLLNYKSIQSNTERLAMWKVSLEVTGESAKNLLFGIGFGGWREKGVEYFTRYYPEMASAAKYKHVHNIYLQLMLETGIVGLLIYLWFIVSLARTLYGKLAAYERGSLRRSFSYGALFSVLCYLIAGLFDYLASPIILIPFYTLMALPLSLSGAEADKG